jgi:hypothetical protein
MTPSGTGDNGATPEPPKSLGGLGRRTRRGATRPDSQILPSTEFLRIDCNGYTTAGKEQRGKDFMSADEAYGIVLCTVEL